MRVVYGMVIASIFTAGVMAQAATNTTSVQLQAVRNDCKFTSLQIVTKGLHEMSLAGMEMKTVTINRYYYKKGNVRIEGKVVNDTGITLIVNGSMAYVRTAKDASVTGRNLEKEYVYTAAFALSNLHSLIKIFKEKKTGTETIGGVQCDVYKDSNVHNKEVTTLYRDKDGIALKTFTPSVLGDQTTTITKMEKNGELPDELFDSSTIGETGESVISRSKPKTVSGKTDSAAWSAAAFGWIKGLEDEAQTEKEVEPVLAGLANNNPAARESALRMGLKNPDPKVRAAIIDTVMNTAKDPMFVKVFIEILGDPDVLVRVAALRGLSAQGDKAAVEPMIRLLKDTNATVRERAATLVGDFKDPRTVEPLLAVLKDPKPSVRLAALYSLGDLKDERTTAPAIALLNVDPNDRAQEVRRAAVSCLRKLGNEAAVDALIKFVSDPDTLMRWRVIDALGYSGSPKALTVLMPLQRDQDREIARRARSAFEECKAAAIEKRAAANAIEAAAPVEPSAPTAAQLAKAQGREMNRRGAMAPVPVPAATPEPAKTTAQESGPTVESLTAEIEKNPKNAMAYQQRGDLYFRGRREAEAIADYEKFIELGKGDASLAAQVSSAELKVKKMKMMLEMRERRSPRR